MLRHKNDFVRATCRRFRRARGRGDDRSRVVPVVNEIRHARRHLRRWMSERRVSVPWQFWPARARVQYQPLGVAGILSAWNYPVFLSVGPMVGALAAGNHVMLKPSELAPRTAELLHTLVAELYPRGVRDRDAGRCRGRSRLSRASPSTTCCSPARARVGKLVMRAASENLTPVTLELGGKSPALIHADYPLRRAVERILNGKLYNAGQTCVAPDYVLLPAESQADFIRLARDAIAALYPRLTGNPDYTRILNAAPLPEAGRPGRGGTAQRRGSDRGESRPERSATRHNRVFPPTLLFGAAKTTRALQEEIFGPVAARRPLRTPGRGHRVHQRPAASSGALLL